MVLLCLIAVGLSGCAADRQIPEKSRVPSSELVLSIGVSYDDLSDENRIKLMKCDVDKVEFNRLMDLDYKAFDQDFDGGWRAVSYDDKCDAAGAILLQVYLERQTSTFESNRSTLRWHAGQMLAANGDYESAIRYFEQTYKPGDENQGPEWNYYVDGTIAFLRKNKIKLVELRDELAQRPVPEAIRASRQKFLDDNPNITMPDGFIDAPMNLSVMNNLIACFDEPYSIAYGKCKKD